jgi:hypothetical protein
MIVTARRLQRRDVRPQFRHVHFHVYPTSDGDKEPVAATNGELNFNNRKNADVWPYDTRGFRSSAAFNARIGDLGVVVLCHLATSD